MLEVRKFVKLFEVSAILFDMDGTLVDSTPIVENTWRVWAEEYGLNPEDVIRFAHGRPTTDVIAQMKPELDARTEAANLLLREELDPTPVHPIPGAMQAALTANEQARWAVVTSATRKLAKLRLSVAGYPEPRVLIAADDIMRGKPDPEGFLRAARELGVDPVGCVVFEDTPAGLLAGAAAGAQVIGLTTTFQSADLPAQIIVPDFESIRLEPLGKGRLAVSVG